MIKILIKIKILKSLKLVYTV